MGVLKANSVLLNFFPLDILFSFEAMCFLVWASIKVVNAMFLDHCSHFILKHYIHL